MAEKNQETEDAFMDELREAIGTSQSVSFHLLIRRVRQSRYIGETARGYAWNIRDIIGHDENLMRRFLESVSLPRDVEAILSDPSYDYQGDRGESLFWGVGGPRLITDAQRAEMRRRRLGGWIEPPPPKRIAVEKKDDPKKKAKGKADELHQPGTSKDFQSGDKSLPSCSKGGKKGEHSRNTSESATAKQFVVQKQDDPKKKAEGKDDELHQPGTSKGFQSSDQSLPSCFKGGKKGEHSRNTSESALAKQIVVEDDPKKDEDETEEVNQMVAHDTSKALQIDNQALPSSSEGGKKGEHSRNTSDLAIEEDTSGDEQVLGVELENQTIEYFSKGKDTDVYSSSSESAKEEDNSDLEGGSGGNPESFDVDKQAIPSCSRDEDTVENLNVSSESVKEEDSCGDDWEDLPEVDSNNETRQSYSESEEMDEHSCDFSESANEDSIEDDGERDILEEISEISDDSYCDDQIVPVREETDDYSTTSSESEVS